MAYAKGSLSVQLYRDNIVFLIAKVHQHAQGVLRKHLQPLGLTPVQCLFLENLLEEDGVPVGEIGRRLTVDTSTLSGVLDRMESAGWVRRAFDPLDGRIARVFLTERAKEATAELADAVESVNRELMSKFAQNEKTLLRRFLSDLKRSCAAKSPVARPKTTASSSGEEAAARKSA